MEKLTLNVSELSQVLGIGMNAAYRLCLQDGFPAVKIGDRRWIISIEGLKVWLEKQAG